MSTRAAVVECCLELQMLSATTNNHAQQQHDNRLAVAFSACSTHFAALPQAQTDMSDMSSGMLLVCCWRPSCCCFLAVHRGE